ncbi:hypothetical protein C7G42_11920 [Bradyrhizobium sp. MOS003]|nr:hypothetical protein C7G42_11920 [Bradyrhizobium sp. MOS003]
MERLVRHSSKSDGGSDIRGLRAGRTAPGYRSAHPGYGTVPVSPRVNPRARKYSTLPKFGFGVCVAHPGSPRGAT